MNCTRICAALFATTSLLTLAPAAAAAEAAGVAIATALSSVDVTAPRQEETARDRQREAPNIISIQSAETIAKYPDFNAAEALGRMPGISISTDTGEGRFVNIRGIDGNLVGATFGGVPLLNTNTHGTYFGGGGRAVEFDTIPTGSVDGLIVTKTTSPDHEAEGLGGSVDITPRSAAEITAPFFDGTLGWGYENAHGRTGPFNIEAALGARFGFADGRLIVEGDGQTQPVLSGWITNPTPFSFVLTASRRDDRRGFDDIEEDYNDPTVDRSYADLQLRRYDYHRRRFGYGGEFEFQPNDDHRYYLRANLAGYTEAVKKNRLTYDDLGDTPGPGGRGFATTTDITLASTDEEETHRNQVYAVGGRDQFGATVLDYRASYSRATYAVAKNYGAKFKGPQGLPFTYDNSANNGDFPSLQVDAALVNDPTLYSPLKKVTNSTESDRDEEWAYAADLQAPVRLLGDADFVKFGGEVRLRGKDVLPSAFTSVIAPLSLAAASTAAVTDFYGGRYTNGPQVNTAAVRAAAQAGTTAGGVDLTGVLNDREDIYAGYAEYQGGRGPWTVLAGVRVEATRAKYGAYSDDNAAQTLAFVQRSTDYTNVFPTVQLRYEVTPQFLIRATYSTGIGRPGFLQNTAATSSNHDPTDPQITTGNPALKPTTGDNFDLSVEYYLPNAGVVQLGLFDKRFSNYIVTVTQRLPYAGADPAFTGLIVDYTTFANRSDAYARGLEAAYHQQFDWLPGVWRGLGFDGNVTLVDSRIEEYDAATSASGRAEFGLLPGTSRLTWNAAGFYEAHGLQVRVAAEYVSKELFSLGGSKATDTIQDNRLTLDFTSSYRISPTWAVYFNVKNLTNAPLRFYVYQSSFPIQREFYDQTFEAGVRAHF